MRRRLLIVLPILALLIGASWLFTLLILSPPDQRFRSDPSTVVVPVSDDKPRDGIADGGEPGPRPRLAGIVVPHPEADPADFVATAETEPSVSQTNSLVERIDRELENLDQGRILFNPPAEMRVGETDRVEVRISRDQEAELSEGLVGRGSPVTEQLSVGLAMKAWLTGSAFDIQSLSGDEQYVAGHGFSQWDFDVTPQEAGEAKSLELHVSVRIQVEGESITRDVPVLVRRIQVAVNPGRAVNTFVAEHWEFLLGSILIPCGAWLLAWAWRRRSVRLDRQRSSEPESK